MQLGLLVLVLVSVGLSAVAYMRHEPLSWRFAAPRLAVSDVAPRFEAVFDYTTLAGVAHAPGIVLKGDAFSLVWFEGSREAQPDVEIHGVEVVNRGERWVASDPAPVITQDKLADVFEPQQLVVTLGNTIENQSVPGALFATVVSVGGWAMASVADVRLGEAGPGSARKLDLSPLLNRSHLVKSPMVEYADGSFALPAYFEMGSTYSQLVRLGKDGRVVDTRRMPSHGVKAIQPMIVPLDDQTAVAFLRDFDPSGRLWVSRTDDGGQSWSDVTSTDIANPSAPVAAVPLSGGRLLAVMNDDAEKPHMLRMSVSDDGGNNWRVIHKFDDGVGDARYPMLRRLESGEILLAYSYDTKRGIRAYIFNEAWVMAQ